MISAKKDRKDVVDRRTQIKSAITKIESQLPFQNWSPKQLRVTLKNQGIIIPRERIQSHLKELERGRYVTKVRRGSYLSAASLLYGEPLKDFLDIFALEYNLSIQEKIKTGEQIILRDIIDKSYKNMIEVYEAHREIQDIINEK